MVRSRHGRAGQYQQGSLPQPASGRDELLSALRNWVEKGQAPDRIELSSKDASVSMPVCAYPQQATYDGSSRDVKKPSSYSCK